MRDAPVSLDPARSELRSRIRLRRRSLTRLMFDTLVTTDESGRVQPSLATAWQALAGSQRWQFRIRRGVKFHDGTALTAEIAAASLRAANPSWNVAVEAESVVIELEKPELRFAGGACVAAERNCEEEFRGKPSGTGPFHIVDWQPGKKLALAAEENCWRGRPFLDAIEIEMGKSFRDQMTALELGKADLVEVAAGAVASDFAGAAQAGEFNSS